MITEHLEGGLGGHLNEPLFLAQLLQFRLLLGRIEEDHELASLGQARISAVTQCHDCVQAVKPEHTKPA